MTREGKPREVAGGRAARDAAQAPAPPQRELLTIDLCGLKTPLLAHCAATGHPASAVVRAALQRHLQMPGLTPDPRTGQGGAPRDNLDIRQASTYPEAEAQLRTRLSLRLNLAEADELQRRAQAAGLSLAAWVLHVMRSGQDPISAEHRAARIAALTASNAELATLARHIAHLSTLLRQGDVPAAQEYRQMLDTVAADVRQHLKHSSQVLAAERRERGSTPTPSTGDAHD